MDHECPLGLSASLNPVMGGYERSDAFFLAVVGASADRLLTALWNGREMVWLPGLFLLVVGKLSGERIGLGDGWLLLALGMWLPYEILMGILFLGLLAGAGYGILSGKKEIPLVPFFTVGFVLTVWGTII